METTTIQTIQELIRTRKYQIKFHAIQHALKEGFREKDMVRAILNGRIIESYPEEQRVLVCGQTELDDAVTIYLHVVCEQTYPNQIALVTAYIPDETLWENPPFNRRRRKK